LLHQGASPTGRLVTCDPAVSAALLAPLDLHCFSVSDSATAWIDTKIGLVISESSLKVSGCSCFPLFASRLVPLFMPSHIPARCPATSSHLSVKHFRDCSEIPHWIHTRVAWLLWKESRRTLQALKPDSDRLLNYSLPFHLLSPGTLQHRQSVDTIALQAIPCCRYRFGCVQDNPFLA